MASTLTFPQMFPVIQGMEPATDNAGRTGDYISMKNAHCAFIVFHITQGNAATILLSLRESPLVSGVGSAATTATHQIWANEDCATSDAMVIQADAANFTTDANVLHKIIVFKFEASEFTAGMDCIAPVTGASNAANITSCQIYLQQRYQQTTPPSAIID